MRSLPSALGSLRLAALLLALAAPVGAQGERTAAAVALACPAGPAGPGRTASGIDPGSVSRTVAPGDDFFRYVNERWIDCTRRPPGYSMFMELNAMYLRTQEQLAAIIRNPGEAAPPAARQKITAAYTSFTDLDAIERRGLAPIRRDLDAIRRIPDHAGVARWMARPGSHSVVGMYVFVDNGRPTRNLVHLDQQILRGRILGLSGGLYARADSTAVGHRRAYEAYVAATLRRAGIDRPEARAAAVLALETRLARVQWGPVQLRDRRANYHPMRRAELDAYAPGFPWAAYLDARGVGDIGELVMNTDTAIRASALIFAGTPVDVWRSYLLFHWIQNHVDYLPAAYRQASSELHDRRLGGQMSGLDRESRGIRFVNDNLGWLVGRIYLDRHFPAGHRDRMNEIAAYVKRAFEEQLRGAAWLDDATRTAALAKLHRMTLLVGYPDDMRDYAEVEIRPDDPIGNVTRLGDAEAARQRAHLGRPASAWGMHLPPQTVDATYSPQLNRIVFPAGMLQPPAFDPCADAALNFGAIAVVMAHELGHGFDDQGSRFDAEGQLRDWWTAETRREFDRRTRRLATQFSGYSPVQGVHLNGELSLGENIADLTGVTVALHAYRLYVRDRQGGAAPVIDGLTGEQRFFLSFARFWRAVEPEAWLRGTSGSTHSPPRYRVNGILPNVDAWYEAFGITDGARMHLPADERVRLW